MIPFYGFVCVPASTFMGFQQPAQYLQLFFWKETSLRLLALLGIHCGYGGMKHIRWGWLMCDLHSTVPSWKYIKATLHEMWPKMELGFLSFLFLLSCFIFLLFLASVCIFSHLTATMTLLKLIIAKAEGRIALFFKKKFLVHPRSIMAAGRLKTNIF